MSNINPKMWDDEAVMGLSVHGKVLWFYLLTGQPAQLVPGLVVAGVAALSEATGLTMDEVKDCQDELIKAKLIQVDRRLTRIPNGPKYNPAFNANMIKGWFRKWQTMPEGPLKYDHVASLRLAINASNEKSLDAWVNTFETVSKPLRNGFETDVIQITSNGSSSLGEGVQGKGPDLTLVPTDPAKPKFDLEALYKPYPKHEGKKEGIEKLTRDVKTQNDYDRRAMAVANYAALCKAENRERKFILQFSTFMNGRWLDFEHPVEISRAPPGRPALEPNAAFGNAEEVKF